MPRPGGESDKLGNRYEAIWTTYCVLDVIQGRFQAINPEPVGDESLGVEFVVKTLDNRPQFHSVKRQKQKGDWSIADLCRKAPNTGRSILGDLFSKRQKYPEAELRFISQTSASELRELTERARRFEDVPQFIRTLNGRLQNAFLKEIVPLCDGDQNATFKSLKSLEVIARGEEELIRSVERRIGELFYRLDRSELRPDDVRRMISEYVLEHLGTEITTVQLRNWLHESGLGFRDWKNDPTVRETVAKINNRYLSVVQTELINASQIFREETEKISELLSDDNSLGALLVAPGGFGKSCVLAQCVSKLSSMNVPTLCLRMDSLEPCNSPPQLGRQLDLPASPATVLAGIADGGPSVLVIDQLDAISIVSGRNPKMWEVFKDLCDEVRYSYPRMKIVLACRDFDLEHDQRLRVLGDSTSGFGKIVLGKLNDASVKNALGSAGHGELKLSKHQIEILEIPFHLLLFLQGEPSISFSSVGELFDRYWDRKRRNVRDRLGREPQWIETIHALTERMSSRQALFAARNVVDRWSTDADAMISEHVLIDDRDRNQIRFFHESFFDYAYARLFEGNLVEFLTSTEQHLFRRGQVRQILVYRRENDFGKYIKDLRDIFSTTGIRFHIKSMVASRLNEIEKPSKDEWLVIEPYLLEGDLSRYLMSALHGHIGWFDLLDQLGVFKQWLDSEDERLTNVAVWYLSAPKLHESRSSRVAEIISPYVDNPDWNKRLVEIFSWGKAYKTPEMSAQFLRLVKRGVYDEQPGESTTSRDFWGQFHDVPKHAPKFMIDILAVWFDRAVERFDDARTPNYLDKCSQNQAHYGAQLIGEAAASVPDYFVEQMLPRVLRVVLKTEIERRSEMLDRTWPHLSNHGDPFEIDDAILLHLRKSLQWLATNDVTRFRQFASTITGYSHQTFAYLLLRAWPENPQEFANECAQYLIATENRLGIGYSSWSSGGEGTGHCAISRMALKAISPHCSIELFQRLELAITGYCDEFERQNPRWRGSDELLLLRSLDRTRLSKKAALRIEELERKFPELTDSIVEEDQSSPVKCIGSPIAQDTADLMTDDQWIAAMQKYDGSTDRFRGGPVELSRLLSEFARRNRPRFAALVKKIPTTVDPIYFSAILDGLCSRYKNMEKDEKTADQANLAATDTDLFIGVIDRLHSLLNRPCGSAIAGCIDMLSDRKLPQRILDVVSFYATSDLDPERDVWQKDAEGKSYYGDPFMHGINCVRGQAARTISSLLADNKSRLEKLRPALEILARDNVISVRTCAITAYLSLLNYDRNLAVKLFCEACYECEPICATPPFDQFVHYAIFSHYDQLRPLLQFALKSGISEAVECAARQITVADLSEVDVGTDSLEVRSGSEIMRKAAVSVYGRNLSDPTVGNQCAARLEEFFDDESELVREEVSRVFWGIKGERLLELKNFISRYIESKAFENDTDSLLHALEESNAELPEIICRAAERVLEFVGDQGASAAYGASLVAHSISTLVVRQYEQSTNAAVRTRCLDLIDRMEKIGYYGISDELNRLDR